VTVTKADASCTTSVVDLLVDMGTVLDEANCPEQDRFVVIPAKMAGLIKKSELKDASLSGDSMSILRNGRLGMIDRFTVYVSHNLNRWVPGGHQVQHHRWYTRWASPSHRR
jgi:hypothetical protein